MASYKQTGRLMKFSSSLGEDVLLIEALRGSEKISHLYDFQVDLLAVAGTEIDPKAIIGTKVTVEIALLEVQGTRYINGLVASFEQTSGGDEFDLYRMRIVPSLWQLGLSFNCRVFQNMTVMDIVKKVISPYGLSMADKTEGKLEQLDYCTQYSESDFAFISRITEQHGIFYYFEHTDGDNKIIFGNSRSTYTDCPLVHKVKYYPLTHDREESYISLLNDFSVTSTMVSGQHTVWDYDFRTYKTHQLSPQASASPYGKNAFEVYTYPAGEEGYVKDTNKVLTTPNHAAGFLTAQAGVSDAGSDIYHGDSTARSFCSGYTFSVIDHPRKAWNRTYLLTEVIHHADQVPPYRSEAVAGSNYTNSFRAIASDILYRPPAITPRPRIYGPQTATVVAPAGEEIHLDKYGRVCVQFFWDRDRKPNTVDSTWLRVAQPWASNGFGTFFWPRANDEVIVQFINGDPDNPIVIGSVYNATNMPKYELPANKTRTGVVTRSSQGGNASTSNELRFEDKKGNEQIYLHAEKDMDHTIENDLRMTIGGKDSLIVTGSQLEKVGSNAELDIGGNRVENIGGNFDLKIGGNQTEKIATNLSIDVGVNHNHKVGVSYGVDSGETVYIKGGMNVVIESGLELTLTAGGGFINIGPAGVAISGTLVLINSGGAAGAGTPVQTTDPASPQKPDQADDGTKGTKM
jgi:type VI secretion system secreted protein VgrG